MSCDAPTEPLIRALQDANAWPHPVGDVAVIETHISWVLLTGTFAYKIKKPVDFGFVDFTTLERRQFFCEEELRLNRRLAPNLYLAVVPITGTVDCAVVEGSGTLIEFAVKMRQFSQEMLLSRLIACDNLAAEHIDSLAEEVADFHSCIEVVNPDTSNLGTPAAILEPVEENFRHLTRADDDLELRSMIDTLHEWSRHEFGARQSNFHRRRHLGFVRECHGDMHLGNMILQRREETDCANSTDSVLIFDGIEFNESFRWIDVLSEVAFVVMDLQDRGRPDFGWRFLNGYLEQTGDYAGLSVLRFYLVYRALVRAKVSMLRCAQNDVDEEERLTLDREFRQYIDLAKQYTESHPTPLIITHGFSGSGKSTGTQPVVEQSGAVRIRSDVERQRLFGGDVAAKTATDIESGIYTSDRTGRTYDKLAELATAAVSAGFPAIVDATFLQRSHRDQFRRLADRLGVECIIADFQVTESVLRERIVRRLQAGVDASEADLSVLEHQLQTHDPIGDDELPFVVTVECGDSTAAELLNAVGRCSTR
ncbi:MAG: AAA family ATPase [Planctomycetaceae bacterium]|jgi:uncharacterized protein|nr:AAA family ATPase [Planctomycetaceae bacterium]MBT6154234.1 AAA family ATPase [Planctomycetaceae bacterium]MBT6485668.1 AAA family ATPase [Planctomycetaceae bacterium]MBT6497430.1 AAA family ATPase [Planctomycetaceae bacterium]